ncbi:hypothetical protein LUZ60_001044 [Juncus effusus]|nr:hypothetical protein LUZ60_001044 [Juncus effusus]
MSSPPPVTARSARLQSPTGFIRLASNDDDLERTQARAAARRRKSLAFAQAAVTASQAVGGETEQSDLMDKDQIMDLFQNCIRLASENKINQKNTWELGLIDHLSEIVKVETEQDNETNFQKASCTLEAGVKIYSLRVDSTHSEAFKVLGGINRAGRDEDQGCEINADVAGKEGPSKKETERKFSPTSTLESSFEALNVKKFDVAFTVDPLYHQTSAQFDEGGAKGLLLYNLGVYGNCRVLFDSFEVPEKCIMDGQEEQIDEKTTIDLSFCKDEIKDMMINIPKTNEISPTLGQIIAQFDEENQRPSSDSISCSDQGPGLTDETNINQDYNNNNDNYSNNDDLGFGGNDAAWDYENDNGGGFNHDDDFDERESVINDGFNANNVNSSNYQEGSGYDPAADEKMEKIADFLSLGLGFSSKSNAWAGPDHWKFRKVKGSEPVSESTEESKVPQKKTKNRKVLPDIKSEPVNINSVKSLFAPPKSKKSLLVPASRVPCNNIRLPEDCHYRPDSLVKLFLRPDVMCLMRKGRNQSYEENDDGFAPTHASAWDDDVMSDNGMHDFGNDDFAPDEPGSLLRKPRQVNKIDIKYDKVSKQVDVHALKEMLWNHIQDSVKDSATGEEEEKVTVLFSEILAKFPNESNEISTHLFFICLLHLANEHNLSLKDQTCLDEIDIEIPVSSLQMNSLE